MKIYKNFKIEKKFQNSAIAIGNFDGFHKVFGGPGNSQPDSPDSADLPETVSGPPEQTLGSPRRGSG